MSRACVRPGGHSHDRSGLRHPAGVARPSRRRCPGPAGQRTRHTAARRACCAAAWSWGRWRSPVCLLVVAGLLIRSLSWLHAGGPGLRFPEPADRGGAAASAGILRPTTYRILHLLSGRRQVVARRRVGRGRQPVADSQSLQQHRHLRGRQRPDERRGESHAAISGSCCPATSRPCGIPLLAGRDIQPTDTSGSSRVVIISKCLAETLFPNRDPLGQHVVIDRDAKVTWEVVGVVGDVKDSDLREEAASRGTFYRAYSQQPLLTMRLAVRTTGDPLAVVAPLRALLQQDGLADSPGRPQDDGGHRVQRHGLGEDAGGVPGDALSLGFDPGGDRHLRPAGVRRGPATE